MGEEELLNKARDGDKWALNILIQNNYKSLYGFLIKLTGDIDLAEDITQEALLKVSLNINKFRGECKFITYLIQIGLNVYKNHVRKKKVVIVNEEQLHNINYNGESHMVNSIEFKEALKYLQDMPYEKRVSFILKHYYGYSIEEISKFFNVAEGTTKSRIHNTIKKLRELMS